MAKKYMVELTDQERERLESPVSKGPPSARKIKRANILLMADAGMLGWPSAPCGHLGTAGSRLATTTQPSESDGRLAIHDHQSPGQAQASLPITILLMSY